MKFDFRYKNRALISLSGSYLVIQLALQEIQIVMESLLHLPFRDSDISYRSQQIRGLVSKPKKFQIPSLLRYLDEALKWMLGQQPNSPTFQKKKK